MLPKLTTAASCLLVFLVLFVAFLNSQNVMLSVFGSAMSVSFAIFALVALLSGIFFGSSFCLLTGANKQKGSEIAAKWDAQDIKLVSQVKSDREKQLEAKIATLEAALKSALKK